MLSLYREESGFLKSMECNKNEAIRAMEVAECKFKEMDYHGAKRFVEKAQKLFSQLTGLHQFLEVIDIHLASINKIEGEFDWYGILGVDPLATEDIIRKQYKMKALAVHPDKNNFVGANHAFMMVSDAWNILSNKEERYIYNEKVNIKTVVSQEQQGNPTNVSAVSQEHQGRPTEFSGTSGSVPGMQPASDGVKSGQAKAPANNGRKSSKKRKRKWPEGYANKVRDEVISQLNSQTGPP